MWCVGKWPQRHRAFRNPGIAGPVAPRAAILPAREGPWAKRVADAAELFTARPASGAVEIDGCPLPEDRRYDLEHDVWWQDDPGSGTARVGVTATLASFAGPFRSLAFRPVEGTLAAGRSVATVESVRYVGAVRLPVEATIVERNAELVRHPRVVNDDPYGSGWVVRVRPVRPDDPARLLREAHEIAELVRSRIRSQHVRCWPATPEVEVIEVGVECSAVLARLNEEIVHREGGDALLLVTDDPTSPIEMVRWSDQTGHAVLAHRTEGSLHQFLVRKEAHPVPRRPRG